MSTFGKTTTGASSTLYNSGRLILSQATLTESATLTSLSTEARTSSTTQVRHYIGVIYTDNSGQPGTLVAQTAEGTLNDTSALWRTANFSGQTLAAGTYWIGVIEDGNSTTGYIQYRDNTSSMALAVSNTYTSGPPATAPTMASLSGPIAVYVTYTPGGATATGDIKVWTGSAWVAKPVKVWTGSAWVQKPVKVWNGTAWVLTSY